MAFRIDVDSNAGFDLSKPYHWDPKKGKWTYEDGTEMNPQPPAPGYAPDAVWGQTPPSTYPAQGGTAANDAGTSHAGTTPGYPSGTTPPPASGGTTTMSYQEWWDSHPELATKYVNFTDWIMKGSPEYTTRGNAPVNPGATPDVTTDDNGISWRWDTTTGDTPHWVPITLPKDASAPSKNTNSDLLYTFLVQSHGTAIANIFAATPGLSDMSDTDAWHKYEEIFSSQPKLEVKTPTAPKPTVFRTAMVSGEGNEKGSDFLNSYDEAGNLLSHEYAKPTATPITKAVKYEVRSDKGYDFNVGLDASGNVVSTDYVGKTTAPKGGTQPLSQVDAQGYTWISGNGGETWQRVDKDPSATADKTYPLPAGWQQSFTDASGNVKTYDPRSGGYAVTGSVPPSPATREQFPLPPGQKQTWTDANGYTWNWDPVKGDYNQSGYNAPATPSGTTTPISQTDATGRKWVSGNGGQTWQLAPEDPTTQTPTTNAGGLYKTPQEALAAAAAMGPGWTVAPLSNGYYIIQPPDRVAPTPPRETFAAPGSQPSAADIEAWIFGAGKGGTYNAQYDINGDKIVDFGDVSAREQPGAGGGSSTFTNPDGSVMTWDTNSGRYVQSGYDAARDTSRQMTDYQKQNLELERQQMAQSARAQEASAAASAANSAWQQSQAQAQLDLQKQQHLADLAAHPINWLQYNSEAGTKPQVQPWMVPLQQGRYGNQQMPAPQPQPGPTYQNVPVSGMIGTSYNRVSVPSRNPNTPWQVGQNIPGYTATNMKGMPELLNPSTQYYARMALSLQQQYAGYQRAQAGETPEDVAWRIGNQAPPSGQFPGLRYNRG